MAKVEKEAQGGSLTTLSRKGRIGTFSYIDEDIGDYVYYRELGNSPNIYARRLGQRVNTKLHGYIRYANQGLKKNKNQSASVVALTALAKQEQKKEEAFLKFTFGPEYSLSFQQTLNRFEGQNPSNILTVLFNEKFALEDDLRRLRKQLKYYSRDEKESKFTPNIGRFFSSYLHQALINYLKENAHNFDLNLGGQQLTRELEMAQPDIIEAGLRLMLNANVINSDEDKTYLHILKELEAQGPIQNSSLFQFLLKNYNISKHTAELASMIKAMRAYQKKGELNKNFSFPQIWQTDYKTGGEITEYLEQLALQELTRTLHGKGFKVSTSHVGQHGKKADNDFVIWHGELDESEMQKILDKAYSTGNDYISNSKAIQDLDQILGSLSKIKEGYHLYISDKDYLLRSIDDKSYRGMSAGDAMNLGIYRKLTDSDEEFIIAIMNTINGAYGDDMDEIVKSHIATDIANLAFDGVRIDDSQNKGNIRAVHIFYLSGYYVPLSSMLFKLAAAFESVDANTYKSFTNIELSKPGYIMYPLNSSAINGNYTNYTDEMWHEQAINALDSIKIKAYFMKSIRQYISKLINL